MGSFCLDGGHGGSDCGAVGPSGLRESDVALDIAMRVRDALVAAGHTVVMTRETDVDVAYPNASASEELQARCDVANNAGVDALIDIHINAFTDPSSRGTETFHYDGSSNGSMLAQYIHCELVGIGLANRGTKTANYYVLKHTDMPAVLTEVAFISNPEEEALLSDPSFRQQVADAITRGVIRWSGN